jgi:hypothetical protein
MIGIFGTEASVLTVDRFGRRKSLRVGGMLKDES